MSGIYVHIPFCKQACHYCDFHFSTSIKKKGTLVDAICREIILRKDELKGEVETLYFGGGTPSLLSPEELQKLIETVYKTFSVSKNAEITLEANPDDLFSEAIAKGGLSFESMKNLGVNRLSIGVQSFFESDLKLMNRAHNASEALESIKNAKQYFDNISIDLIYGIPNMTSERWAENLKIAVALEVPHLSCYALTVEPKTALETFIKKGIVPPVDDELAATHYRILIKETERAGFENYEFSNFGKEGYHSKNNTAYWQGKPYLGVGPSAHSFDGDIRSWNVRNNTKYIKAIEVDELPIERETLTVNDKFNEYVMTALRTKWGISLKRVEDDFGSNFREYLLKQAKNHLEEGLLYITNDTLLIGAEGKFLSDGIASDLFLVNLDS